MFDIQGSKIKLSTDELAIPPFKEYYNEAKDKTLALKEIEYIVWLHKWNTPYEAYPENERADRIAQDLFHQPKYEMSDALKALAQRYIEFQQTPGTRLLATSQRLAESLMQSLDEFSKNAMDIDTALKATRILKDVGPAVKSLDVAMKQARAEQLDSGKVKGGGTIGLYEIPK